ncbi:flagellar basal-body MS-ring/collar protein FliF [Pseudokordiimonas caeni]|uniref:flagellar basal-body MS-ring/collar protein FliF n=1 Tax=Pseudokordiimonas caeni TaxID=2997908 RepID=UPI0028120AB6|nr:flagellar basal-body MS-ring/collar protein FliF [Pseudokordiimonas caeni]
MDGLLQFLRNMGTGRLIAMAVVGALTVGFFALIIGQLQTKPMTTLYSDLEAASAASIVERLEADQIPYETAAGGSTIRVPSDQVDRLRILLAGEGLSGSLVGKELFDQGNSFGRTSFELNVNYVRAIEGELARTIRYIQSVQEARVHIVMPERRPFQREAAEPTASIMIKPKGPGLTGREAQAIQALVASAVPGLSPDRVTITDTNGRLLSDGAANGDMARLSTLEEARLAREQLYREKIENLLASRVGMGKVRAEVAVSMDMNRTTRSETEFDPEGQVILSQTVGEERAQETDPQDAVTVDNNLPEAQQGGNQAAGGPTSTSQKSNEVTNFQNSKTETVTVQEPGQVSQIRVSVLVDGIRDLAEDGTTSNYQDRPEAEIESLRNLVLTAIPFDEARGDAVTVQSMRFADPPPMEPLPPTFNLFGMSKQDLLDIGAPIGLFILAVLVLLLVVRPIVTRVLEGIPDAAQLAAEQKAMLEAQQAPPALMGPDSPITAEVVALAAAGDENAAALVRAAKESGTLDEANLQIESKIDVAKVEGKIKDSALKKVAEIIKSNPDDSVAIVRTWLYAE